MLNLIFRNIMVPDQEQNLNINELEEQFIKGLPIEFQMILISETNSVKDMIKEEIKMRYEELTKQFELIEQNPQQLFEYCRSQISKSKELVEKLK